MNVCQLAPSAPHLRRYRAVLRTLQLWVALVVLVSATPVWARYTPPPPCPNKFTPEQERTEGAKVAAEVYQQMPVLPESDPVSQYIAQLGARLAQHAPGDRWPYSYHVVASADIN